MAGRGPVVAVGAAHLSPGRIASHILRLVGPQRPVRVAWVGPQPESDAFGEPVVPVDPGPEASVVVASGSDPESLVAWLRASGREDAVRRAWADGTVLVGIGDASACWFACGVVQHDEPALAWGLGLIDLSVCTGHQDTAVAGYYHGLISRLVVPRGIGIDDGAAAVIVQGHVREVVADLPGAHAYTLEQVAGEVILKAVWSS